MHREQDRRELACKRDYFCQGVPLQRLADHLFHAHALAKPALYVVAGVPRAPVRARASMAVD